MVALNKQTLEQKTKALVGDLLKQTPEEERCLHLAVDDVGPYCSKNLNEDSVSEKRRLVCGVYSLQLWCLDKKSCVKCIYYQGEPI